MSIIIIPVNPRLHQDTCCPETCVPDEQLVSGYIFVDGHMLPDTSCSFGIHVDCISDSRRHNYYSFISRSTRLYSFVRELVNSKASGGCRNQIVRVCAMAWSRNTVWRSTDAITIAAHYRLRKKNSDGTSSVIYLIVDIDNVDERVQLRYPCVVGAVDRHSMNVITVTEYQIRLRNWKQVMFRSLLCKYKHVKLFIF